MGYSTDFDGEFSITPPLTPEHRKYLTLFSETRRMQRETYKAELLFDPVRIKVGLPIGPQGAYFVGDQDHYDQERDPSIIEYNDPPYLQPGLWCNWAPNEEGTAIEWNGSEKFYNYIEWLQYLILNFFEEWGYELNREVTWQGEDHDDAGKIEIIKNKINVYDGVKRYKLRE